MPQPTAEELANLAHHEVQAYAYHDRDGKYYSVDDDGNRTEVTAGAKLADGTPVQPLSAKYQGVADQTAAMMLSFGKLKALNPQERSMLASLFKTGDKAGATISDSVKNAYDEFVKSSGISFDNPVSETVNTVGGVINGAKLPFSFMGDLLNAGSDIWDQVSAGEMSRDRALAIGTAYASARQSAEEGRPVSIGVSDWFKGVFSKNFGGYLGAGFAWLLDTVTGMAEHLPVIGDWIKEHGWHKNKTLAEHLGDSLRESDNERVQREMGELAKIGGVRTGELAVLTQGGTVLKTDGTEANIAAADKENIAPGNADGETPTLAQAEAAKKKEPHKNTLQRAADGWKQADFSDTKEKIGEHPIAATLGTAAVGAAAYRTGKGFVNGTVKGAANHLVGEKSALRESAAALKKEADELIKQSNAALDKAVKAEAGDNGWKIWNKSVDTKRVVQFEKEADELAAKAAKKLDQMEKALTKAAERDATVGAKSVFGSKTMLEVANEASPTIKSTNQLSRLGDGFEKLGHALGRTHGKINGKLMGQQLDHTETLSSKAANLWETASKKTSSAWEWASSKFGSTATKGAETAEKEVATHVGEQVATKVGAKALGRLVTVGIPVAGEVIGAHEDIADSYHAAVKGDSELATRKGLRAASEMAGGWAGMEAGAAAGAAVGVWFGGVGAAPGAVIGGIVGGVGGFLSAQKVADVAYEYKDEAAAKKAEEARTLSIEAHPGITAAVAETTTRTARQRAHGAIAGMKDVHGTRTVATVDHPTAPAATPGSRAASPTGLSA